MLTLEIHPLGFINIFHFIFDNVAKETLCVTFPCIFLLDSMDENSVFPVCV